MPRYGFYCSECQSAFEQTLASYESDLMIFCPQCSSLAQRDPRDYQSVSLMKQSSELRSSKREEHKICEHAHIHSETECPAHRVDWEKHYQQLEKEEQTEKS